MTITWSLLLLLSATLANAAEISRRDDEPNLQTNVIDLDADESDPLDNANKGLGLFEGDEILDKDQEEFEEGLADTDRTWIQVSMMIMMVMILMMMVMQ